MNINESYRPSEFTEMVGQQHLVGPSGVLTQMVDQNQFTSCIFYGPPGCGKTTAAKILSTKVQKPVHFCNATNTTVKEIQTIANNAQKDDQPVILYLDEIQYFNKKQQQTLLPYLESGIITLIAATTDNPYFACIDALLSRCAILEFKPVSPKDIQDRLTIVLADLAQQQPQTVLFSPPALQYIAENSAGDMRKALNLANLVLMHYSVQQNQTPITKEQIIALLPSVRTSRFDSQSDVHYNLISALQKSIRGSDPNAAIFYLARLLEGGDLDSTCRRLQVIANEDIGLANPEAVIFTRACVEMAKELGLPEANKPLTNAVLYLALSKKSSTCEDTYYAALHDVKQGLGAEVPMHLQHAHAPNYRFPHDFPNHWCPQQYLPTDISHKEYYHPDSNNFETTHAKYHALVQEDYYKHQEQYEEMARNKKEGY